MIRVDVYPRNGPKVSGLPTLSDATHELLVSLVILISCIACNRLILSLRGLYYSRVEGVSTTSGMLTQGHSIQVSPPSIGVVISSDTTTFVAHGIDDIWEVTSAPPWKT
jgi:hypothetical protein